MKYFKYRKLLFLFALLAAALCGLFWGLSGAAATDVLYSLLLLLTALLLTVALDFFLFRRRLKELQALQDNLMHFEQTIPDGGNAVEQAYSDIAEGLLRRLRQETDALDRLHRDDIEYYTLWMHQIKTPLAALSLLLESEAADKVQMKRELFQIERYVDMALNYARTARLSSDLIIAPCDVGPVVHECIRKYAPLFIAKGLRAQVDACSLVVPTDAKWLAFIIEQLLSNAVKYTSRGGVHIYSKDGALIIEDTGAGIRAEDLPRVFERGYTGYNGRMDKRASGLGLSQAKRVAEGLKIRIRLESEAASGTRAILLFPRDELIFE